MAQIQDIPRLISASGKNPCCCASEFALVLRPTLGEGEGPAFNQAHATGAGHANRSGR